MFVDNNLYVAVRYFVSRSDVLLLHEYYCLVAKKN